MWSTKAGGGFRAASSRSAITGFGAGRSGETGFSGCILIDDPSKPDDVRSEVIRKSVIENYENTISTRVNSPDTPIVIIMQRLHEEDLSGHLLSGKSISGKFTHINLPAIKEDDGNPYDKRKIGEALFPKKHSLTELKRMETANIQLFAGQYQQRPAPVEGNIVKREWLKFYYKPPDFYKFKLISCDLTFKESGTSSVVFGLYGLALRSEGRYLLDQMRGHWDFVKSIENLELFMKRCGTVNAILVENKANGPAMISVLKNKIPHLVPIEVSKSKAERLAAESPQYESGNVFYPDQSIKPWIAAHVEEVLTFPNAKTDDRVDCESMALMYIREKMGHGTQDLLEDFMNV